MYRAKGMADEDLLSSFRKTRPSNPGRHKIVEKRKDDGMNGL